MNFPFPSIAIAIPDNQSKSGPMPSLTIAADCLMEDIFPPLEDALKTRLTIANPKYTAAKKYGRWLGKNVQATLKYYELVPKGLRFPRGFANQAVRLCREFQNESPEIHERRVLLAQEDFCFTGSLRPYQQLAVEASKKRSLGVLSAGTGSGKTVMALAIIASRRQPTLVLVHTKELLYQWQQRIEEFLGYRPGLIGDGKFTVRPLSVAIVNTARKRSAELLPHFGQLVVDECHRVPASLFVDVVSAFKGHYLLGLSATAFRSDAGQTKLIYFFMGDCFHEVDPAVLKRSGAVVLPERICRLTSFVYPYRGDYQSLIAALVQDEGRNEMIVRDVARLSGLGGAEVQLLVSDRVLHCQVLTEGLRAQGVEVALLTGKTSSEQRVALVAAVRQGEVQVLVATLQLIGEGFDCPGLTNLFLATPVAFEGRFLQVLGRIMRPAKGKRAVVYDYVDEGIPVLKRSATGRKNILDSL